MTNTVEMFDQATKVYAKRDADGNASPLNALTDYDWARFVGLPGF